MKRHGQDHLEKAVHGLAEVVSKGTRNIPWARAGTWSEEGSPSEILVHRNSLRLRKLLRNTHDFLWFDSCFPREELDTGQLGSVPLGEERQVGPGPVLR